MNIQTDRRQLFAKRHFKKHPQGFTLNELFITMAIIAILTSLAIPTFSSQIPNLQLRRAARDLYSHMQWAKTTAIKNNISVRINFDPTPGREGYTIWSEGSDKIWDKMGGDDVLLRYVSLADYGGGVSYGKGDAKYDATVDKGKIPEDGISYQNNNIRFRSNGTVTILGYVYFHNRKGENFAVGSRSLAGIFVIKRWMGQEWQ